MRTTNWYVIQVHTGRELQAIQAILGECQVADNAEPERAPLVQECFSPRYVSQFKLHGEWHEEEHLLLPGYIVAITNDPWRLSRVMQAVPGITRILRMGETYSVLSEDDRSWIERWTLEGERIIPMSYAHKEGDRLVITDGPLVGNEAMITKVWRRRNLAELEIHAGRVTIRTTVGLAVLPTPALA